MSLRSPVTPNAREASPDEVSLAVRTEARQGKRSSLGNPLCACAEESERQREQCVAEADHFEETEDGGEPHRSFLGPLSARRITSVVAARRVRLTGASRMDSFTLGN